MNSGMWILWVILGGVLIVAEIFTPGFVLLWFGIGALAAAFAAIFGISSLAFQFLIFSTVSIALTAASRTIFVKYFVRESAGPPLKSGVSALPGRTGIVISSSRGALNEGSVKLLGSTWTAFPAEGEDPLEAGDRVTIERVQGSSVYVRRFEEHADWRGKTDSKKEPFKAE